LIAIAQIVIGDMPFHWQLEAPAGPATHWQFDEQS